MCSDTSDSDGFMLWFLLGTTLCIACPLLLIPISLFLLLAATGAFFGPTKNLPPVQSIQKDAGQVIALIERLEQEKRGTTDSYVDALVNDKIYIKPDYSRR